MRAHRPPAGLLAAALLALFPGLFPARADAQISCITRTECVEKGLPYTNQNPGISFGSPSDTVYEARQDIKAFVGDSWGIDEYSRTLTVTGGTLRTGPGWSWNKPVTSGWITGSVDLALGSNVITARICDLSGKCTTATHQVVYQVPPPPPSRTAATLRNLYNADNRNLATCDGCAEGVLTYATPAYVSMDQPRSVTLFYSATQARPRGFVEVEALERSPDPAAYMTLELRDAGGALVTLDNGQQKQFYKTGAGLNRLAASFDASALSTGMYTYTAYVTSHWSDGTSTSPVQIAVRVAVVNESSSPFGWGWSVAGLERLYFQSNGILLVDGSGGVQWFSNPSCTSTGCTYQSPPGEAGTLTRVLPNDYYVRSYPDGQETHFYGAGQVAVHMDRFGNRVNYEYSGGTYGLLTGIVDPAGMRTRFTYHPGNYLATIVDPGGRASYVWYSGIDVWQIHSPDARMALDSISYSDHRLTGYLDARRGRWNVTYDAAWRMARAEAPAVTDGGVTARATTTFRSRESAVLPLPGTGTAGSPARRVTTDTAALAITADGQTVRVWTDPFGLVTKAESPAGTTTLRRNGRGQVLSVDDGKGNVVEYDYMTARPWQVRSASTVRPDGFDKWIFDYGAYGSVSRVVQVEGPTFDHVLDALGRRTATLRNGDTIAWFGYDASGRLASRRDAKGHTTTYAYQPSGTTRNLASVTAEGVTTEQRYDALGRAVRTVVGGAAGDSVAFDAMNRLASVTASVGTTRFGYTVNGVDLDDVVDPLGQRYQFRHNVVGWVTQEIDPGSRIEAYGYFPATGAVRTLTDRRGNTVTLTRDERGRPLTRTAPGESTTWRYDPAGRYAVAVNAASYDSISFDTEGKVTSAVTRRGGVEFSVQRSYDVTGRPDSVIVSGPWGSSVTAYTQDRFGRMDGIRDATGRWTQLFFNGEDLADSVRLPTTDTARTWYRYTNRHQLSSVVSKTVNQSRTYAYTPLGLTLRDSIHGISSWEHQYGYDMLNRLGSWELHKFGRKRVCYNIRECATVDTDSLAQSLSFSWDAVGNPSGATRDPGNRLRAYGGFSYEYDLDGNVLRKYSASGFDQYFSWNALGQLAGTGRTGAGWVTYDYDGYGRRVRRVDQTTGAVTHYVYDGDDLVLEVDGAGNRIREYTYFPGIDRPHSMRQWAGGAGGAIYYYQMQKPGHVSGLVNTGNQLVNEYRYTPFGTPVNGYPVQGTTNPLQYMGRELDAHSGLYYVRNRWYDPQQGRFISEDPIGLAGGINQYAYAGDNPVSFRDPMGLCHDGGALLTEGWAGSPFRGGSGVRYFQHNQQEHHLHALGDHWMICEPVTPPGGNGGWMGGGGRAGSGSGGFGPIHSRSWHYSRNRLNSAPPTLEAAELAGWDCTVPATLHQLGPGADQNVKCVSGDGRQEGVYDGAGALVTDPLNMGTYNRAPPEYWFTHFYYDMVPYYLYGNSAADPSNPFRRVCATVLPACR